MINHFSLFTILFLGFSCTIQAQQTYQKYWVFFKDKQTENYQPDQHLSPKTIQNRIAQGLDLVQETDIPLTLDYVKKVSQRAHLVCQSKWLNAVSVRADQSAIKALYQLPFVRHISCISSHLNVAKQSADSSKIQFGTTISEMNSQAFLSANLTGKNITIGVIDAGFFEADQDPFLAHVFQKNQLLGFRDFVDPNRTNFFSEKNSDDENHGTQVLTQITGKKSEQQLGLALDAQFYLARTDDVNREFRREEDYWISAMEWMDSLGVRLINTSLGYSFGFDDPKENYKPEEMDGKTTKITQMAELASTEKGILIVASAGNEGFDSWRVLSAPADAQSVLSVGATNRHQMKAFYSSVGTESLAYLKPEIVCYSSDGTSFSAPVITGFVACLMQKKPQLSVQEIKEIVEKSGHLYPYGNNFIGYGIPDAQKALQLLDQKQMNYTKLVRAKGQFEVEPNLQKTKEKIIFFHKKDEFRVVEQVRKNMHKKRMWIKPKQGIKRTTMVRGKHITEIIWE